MKKKEYIVLARLEKEPLKIVRSGNEPDSVMSFARELYAELEVDAVIAVAQILTVRRKTVTIEMDEPDWDA